jgi:hypothetical protein
MAQSLAYSLERDGVIGQALERNRRQNRRDLRTKVAALQAQISSLELTLGELRETIALEHARTISLPQ